MGEVCLLLPWKKLLIMKNMKHFKTYLGAMALALSGCQSATDSCETTELWYAQPAEVWMESLPIGNGRYDLWWNRGRETGVE